MAEVGTKHAHVEASSVTHPDHGPWANLVSGPQPRRKVGPLIVDVSVKPNIAVACHAVVAIAEGDVGETTLAFAVYVFGEVNLPTQAIVEGEFRGGAPSVLGIIEHAMLTFCRVHAGADVAAQLSYVAEHKGREIKSAQTVVGGSQVTEGINARAVGVAGHPQIARVTNVATKFELMVAVDFRHVGDPLELLLALDQGAVAARNAQAIAKVRAYAVHVEFAEARGKGRLCPGKIGVRNAEVGHGRDACVRFVGERVILEKAEPKIPKQRRTERLGYSARQAVVMHVGTSCETARAKPDAAHRAQTGFAGQAEVIKAEAAEHLDCRLSIKVDSSIEAVLVVGSGAGADEVVGCAATSRVGEGCENLEGRGRHRTHRHLKIIRCQAACRGNIPLCAAKGQAVCPRQACATCRIV